MFTGIVEESGVVRAVRRRGRAWRLDVRVCAAFDAAKIGDSIAVDGVCLTIVGRRGDVLSFDVMPETWQKTTLSKRRPGHRVNVEQALRVGDRVGGHFVTGHVDGTGIVRSKRLFKGNLEVCVSLPLGLRSYVVDKGSICVDGISLTVTAVDRGAFSVYLIPHTAKVTTLASKGAGDTVNIECDMLLKREAVRT